MRARIRSEIKLPKGTIYAPGRSVIASVRGKPPIGKCDVLRPIFPYRAGFCFLVIAVDDHPVIYREQTLENAQRVWVIVVCIPAHSIVLNAIGYEMS